MGDVSVEKVGCGTTYDNSSILRKEAVRVARLTVGMVSPGTGPPQAWAAAGNLQSLRAAQNTTQNTTILTCQPGQYMKAV